MAVPGDEDWRAALTRSALPGSVRVTFSVRTAPGETIYSLRCRDEAGQPIGDTRDYDLLKVAMGRMERLAEAAGAPPFTVSLDLSTGVVSYSK